MATEDQVIAAFDVVNDANDYHQFKPMLDQAQKNREHSQFVPWAADFFSRAGIFSLNNSRNLLYVMIAGGFNDNRQRWFSEVQW